MTELNEDQKAILADIANVEIEEQRRQTEPLRPTRQELLEQLEAKGVVIQKNRFCWWRGKFHRSVGWFYTGTASHGGGWSICGECGHTKRTGYIGYNPAPR